MKAMKKLIPAICLLLISAVLLGTSTYAWFSMNTTVTANGMEVKATTSKNLVIANSGSGATFGVSASASHTGTAELTPCSTSVATTDVLSAGKFFYVSNNDSIVHNTGAAQTSTTFAAATVTADGDNTYVSAHTFKIKVEGSETDKFTNVYVSSISVLDNGAAPDSAISKALRVAVVSGSHAYIFTPVTGATATYKGVIAADTGITEGTTISSTNETITATGTGATIGEVGSETPVEVIIYIWYEGQDANCTSLNSVSVETLKVEVQFTGTND